MARASSCPAEAFGLRGPRLEAVWKVLANMISLVSLVSLISDY
jgi:hypothetical protein